MAGKREHELVATATEWSCSCGRHGVFYTHEQRQAWSGTCPGEPRLRSLRVPDDVWEPAAVAAAKAGTDLSKAMRAFLEACGKGAEEAQRLLAQFAEEVSEP